MSTSHGNTDESSVFRAFDADEFIPLAGWRKIEPILNSNGGSYGLTGARGAGKTWLILNAIDWAKKRSGMGLWYPSPSIYEAQDFLTSLADNFAIELQSKLNGFRLH